MSRRKPTERKYISLLEAARRIGIPSSTLCDWRKLHPLYAPAVRGIPAQDSPERRIKRPFTWFHVEQVRLIERVVIGNLPLDTAWGEWKIIRDGVGRRPFVPNLKRPRSRAGSRPSRSRAGGRGEGVRA